MPRPVWTGTISFGLVAIPVKLFHAARRKQVSFNQLDDRTMSRIRYQKVSGDTGEPVPDEHIVKGYEISKGQYVIVDPDELDALVPTATKTVDLTEFVELAEVDPSLFDSSYHVAPASKAAEKPYLLLARAMEAAERIAIGRFVMRNKQYTTALRAVDGRLLMSTLVYADEVVAADEIDELAALDDVELDDREMSMAEHLVESLAAPFALEQYRDEYREQVEQLIEQKAAGEEIEAPDRPAEESKVVDLMAALEASVEAAKRARSA